MIGKKFGRWTVIELFGKNGKASTLAYKCKCTCGNEKVVNGAKLRTGESRSCGCLKAETQTAHGDSAKGKRLYHIWENMKQRCTNPSNSNYSRYGGRGISICKEWLNSYVAFKEWALQNGYSDTLTLDRINNNGNYCPENCRWATKAMQDQNKRQSVMIDVGGVKKCATEWAREFGIRPGTVLSRIHYGWSTDKLFSPVQHRGRKNDCT